MGSSASKIEKRLADAPVVLIVGGGFAGISVAKALDKSANVVVFDRKKYFYQNIAALRASVAGPSAVDDVCFTYDNALEFGHIVHGEVTAIDRRTRSIFVHGHDHPIHYDYLVIATGTSYSFPLKVAEPKREHVRAQFDSFSNAVRNAWHVAIVGGGAVGVELAGEIRDTDAEKKITLVHSAPELITGSPNAAFRESIRKRLVGVGVDVILNERVVIPDDARQRADDLSASASDSSDTYHSAEDSSGSGPETPSPGLRYLVGRRNLQTRSGGDIEDVDLVVFATGAAVNTSSYRDSGFTLNKIGRIKTDEFLRAHGSTREYAIGDCSEAEDRMMAFLAIEQGKLAAGNILADVRGKSLKPYRKGPNAIVVPIGAHEGAMAMGDKTLGKTVTRMLKGKDLGTPKFKAMLGIKGADAGDDNNVDVHRLAVRLGVPNETADLIVRQSQPIHHGTEITHT